MYFVAITGCILLNTAVESDDAYPMLRERARRAMNLWRDLIRKTVERGIAQGVMRPMTDPDSVATLIIGTLEGALMMTKLFDDPLPLRRAVEHLLSYVDSMVKA